MYTIGFDIGTFFQNLTDKGKEWGGYFVAFLGVVLVIYAIINIVKAFISHGRGQQNWLVIAGALLVGGWLAATGAGMANIFKVADTGIDTIDALGTGSGGGGGGTTP